MTRPDTDAPHTMFHRLFSRPDQFGRTPSIGTAVIYRNGRGAWTSSVAFHGGEPVSTNLCLETENLSKEKSRVASRMGRVGFKPVSKWEPVEGVTVDAHKGARAL